jgi:mediator of RNA polymerase II transcription subunit 18, fungi type
MHELFASAAVPHSLLDEVLKILQGLCAMTPMRHLERRLIFEGPKVPPLLGKKGAQLQKQNPNNILLWRDLHEHLVRQSYYITVSYDVDEAQFGEEVSDDHEDTKYVRSSQ